MLRTQLKNLLRITTDIGTPFAFRDRMQVQQERDSTEDKNVYLEIWCGVVCQQDQLAQSFLLLDIEEQTASVTSRSDFSERYIPEIQTFPTQGEGEQQEGCQQKTLESFPS